MEQKTDKKLTPLQAFMKHLQKTANTPQKREIAAMSPQELIQEYDLIQQKKSLRSYKERVTIAHIVEHIREKGWEIPEPGEKLAKQTVS